MQWKPLQLGGDEEGQKNLKSLVMFTPVSAPSLLPTAPSSPTAAHLFNGIYILASVFAAPTITRQCNVINDTLAVYAVHWAREGAIRMNASST